ncbi:hypothetical protein [Mammaliicoccus vitulinus]|uniref:Uncharacterized protein n=1 Tax=Mammaliicoccus vitulinus TaxID=71237 RepID=A0A2T4PVD0_9STAP|nr:hypothetical protein [Mammaliicoccus vitulinus]PTI30399.1 hypothetical protein BU072_03045 [Mammaliicoccus vitulinus]PTI88911.1 hypothetical protein BU071_08410 [Mammaliicoccus vitulinus]RIN24760.1 hypothetical protein BU070_02550 [Mammaliicoccus vitulinus]RTX86734.1 hypothetical protein CD108_07765 [Mammaliicoccus vitulinus]
MALKKQDEMERQHILIASKYTVVYFIFALVIYNLYTKFTTGEYNVVWIILLIGVILFTSIQTYFKFVTRN